MSVKQRLIGLVAAIALMLAVAGNAGAVPGNGNGSGNGPNDNACHGYIVSIFASNGYTPGQVAQYLRENGYPDATAGDLNKLAKALCDEVTG